MTDSAGTTAPAKGDRWNWGQAIDAFRLDPHHNNLNAVRLVLASAVIWSHSWWRITGQMGADDLSRWIGAPLASYAVDGFFFLSGFLVYRSLETRGSVVDFARARLARLWPGLAVAVLLIALIGWGIAGLPLPEYLTGHTRQFILGNLSLTRAGFYLTGVMCGAEPCNVNGSLWTITWEVRCYALLALLALVGLASRQWMTRLVLPASAVGALVLHVPQVTDLLRDVAGEGALYNLMLVDRLWTMFALGIAASIWRDRIRLSWVVAIGLFVTMRLSQMADVEVHLSSLFTGYAVLCAGFMGTGERPFSARWHDFSYGMYIYAFPVMMALAATFDFRNHAALAAANFAATLPLAALSWFLVEKPVLDRVRAARKRRKEAVVAEPA